MPVLAKFGASATSECSAAVLVLEARDRAGRSSYGFHQRRSRASVEAEPGRAEVFPTGSGPPSFAAGLGARLGSQYQLVLRVRLAARPHCVTSVPSRRLARGETDHSARRGNHCAPLGGISARRAISACGSPRKRAQSSVAWPATLCVGLVGHRAEGALDPISLCSNPWSVLDPWRMREDGRVSAHRFDQRDVEQVVPRLSFTATHDPRVSGTSHTKFVPLWSVRNPFGHPRGPAGRRRGFEGSSSREGRTPCLILFSVYQTSGGLKPCAALAAPVAASAAILALYRRLSLRLDPGMPRATCSVLRRSSA